MWKQFSALTRGRAFERAEAITDRHALTILRQQIRDCAGSLQVARRDIAVATIRNREEEQRLAELGARIADLETRTIAALDQDKGDLAREAASAIAGLEEERDRSQGALARLQGEVDKLQRFAVQAEQRLRQLRLELRLLEAGESVQRLRSTAPGDLRATLSEAEHTLDRLRGRQREGEAAEDLLDTMGQANDPATILAKLAEAGCGEPPAGGADAVLRRLAERRAARAS
ncbi:MULTISPECIES: PspA/IM30 family protein [unclassified Aureimonas]|uniref:PspA/IM30 family protein n=1 Tax=unclassified Aureimonas TaxID=2615206 RepID=UPI00071F30EE|nr:MULTISPECIES: PspA/IM30 family protein [unclassified Aureimonas]ALN75479.1 hypothetical protein M673_22315 [Aureimonas sp. AU20]